MQIVEVSLLGIRSAVIELRHPEYPMRFRLFPMMHIGQPAFYRQVARRLRECDLIVSEGDDRPSSMGHAYLLAMRLTRQRGARSLVRQDIDHAALGLPVRWPDTSGSEHDRRGGLGFLGWLDVIVFTPVLAAVMAFGGRRWLFQRAFEVNDDSDIRLRFFQKSMLEDRDVDLLATLDAVHEERHTDAVTIAVVYGAGHLPAVIHGLHDKHGYRARSADWLTVLEF